MHAPPRKDPEPKAPEGFAQDVRRAGEQKQTGMLGLLGVEARSYAWMTDGLQLVMRELDELSEARLLGWDHAILFTGHMIDAPGRTQPRFPASAEGSARAAMATSLKQLKDTHPGRMVGIAGGANGGDLLFHEGCAALEIETLLRLTLPPKQFLETSVASVGAAWVERFHALVERLGTNNIEVLGDSTDLPPWMGERKNYDVWQRTNLWLVQDAIAKAPARSLLALWDGEAGDGPGGTQHLVETAPGYGIVVAPIIRTKDLIG